MFKKIIHALTVLSVLFGALTFAGSAAAAGGRRSTAKGTLVAIDSKAQTLTVAPAAGPSVTIKVSQSTSIKRKGRSSNFAALRVGDKASVSYNAATNTASSVSDTPSQYEIHGTVEAVDTAASTLTVASEEGGTSVVLNVDANTVITRNGAAVSLADLLVGDKVEAKYDSATMLASKIEAEAEDGEVHGTIAAVDTAASTVTITPNDGSADLVLNVTESTVIKRDDAVVTLADLVVGDPVEAKYDTASMVASKIEVEGDEDNDAEIHGTVSAVDTAAGTVTITPSNGSPDVVLSVNDSTVIKRNDVVIALADLQVGEMVEAKYDPASMVASKIEVDDSPSQPGN